MRMYFPEIYPDELVYSWFGRFAVHSGYINSQLLQFLYCKRSDTPIKEFIGNLNSEARECIAKIYPLKELVLNILCTLSMPDLPHWIRGRMLYINYAMKIVICTICLRFFLGVRRSSI